VSEDPKHGATTIRASKGGGGGKWLLGAVAAVVIAGGAYAAWNTLSPNENREADYAINNAYDDDLRAGPLDTDADTLPADATSDEPIAAPASTAERPPAPAQRTVTASAEPVPEETIGITPASATVDDNGEIVVTGARRPIWASTPTARRLNPLYPSRALERGREGEARLSCTVQERGALDCVRIEETPGGFGTAALRVARTFRHSPTLADGRDATGTPVNLRVVSRLEDEDRRGRG